LGFSIFIITICLTKACTAKRFPGNR